ncbi:MAG: M23 family metallopeptidase [Syntrophobacteria bacterium]
MRKRRNLYVKRDRRPRARMFTLGGVLVVSVFIVMLWLAPRQQPLSTPLVVTHYPDRFAQKKQYRESVHRSRHQVRSGDTFYMLLVDHGVSPGEVEELLAACTSKGNLQRLRTGELVELFFDKSSERLEKVRYQDKAGHVLAMSRGPWGWVESCYTKPLILARAVAEGTIEESLYQSALDENIDFELAAAMADIFAWDIDFYVDLRQGDRYALLYERRLRDGKHIGNGRILAAYFDNAGSRHQAYYYQVPGGKGDYYDAEGRSLRKIFLKSPLRYTRISSGFSMNRLHPILKIYRPHPGIDYAAPVGTPVVAVGDGRVVFKGWKSGYGRFVVICHNSSFTTTYGHLSRYAVGLQRGGTVKQGQVIGYVGATGLATGPHLDFRMKKNGRFVNPLRVRLPAADPVPSSHLAAFQSRVAFLQGEISELMGKESPSEGTETSMALAADNRQ